MVMTFFVAELAALFFVLGKSVKEKREGRMMRSMRFCAKALNK